MKFSFLSVVVLATIIGGGDSLQAGVISIPNGDFSAPDASESPYARPDIVAWQKAPLPDWWLGIGYSAEAWDQTCGVFYNVDFPGQHIDNLTSPQAAFLFATPGVELYQDLQAVFEIGMAYQLSVGLIGGGAYQGNGMKPGSPIELRLYYRDAGNDRISAATKTVTYIEYANPSDDPTNGRTHMPAYLLELGPVAAGDAWAGKNIGLQIICTNDFANAGGFWDVGNIQLTAVPEPASLALLTCGFLGLLTRRRR